MTPISSVAGRLLSITLILVCQAGSGRATELPFVGTWNCEVATFKFTARTYNNGTKTIHMSGIEFGKKADFLLRFPDGYRLSLLNVKKTSMIWHSPISGDTFECRRIR